MANLQHEEKRLREGVIEYCTNRLEKEYSGFSSLTSPQIYEMLDEVKKEEVLPKDSTTLVLMQTIVTFDYSLSPDDL
jgi:hypothetical protein